MTQYVAGVQVKQVTPKPRPWWHKYLLLTPLLACLVVVLSTLFNQISASFEPRSMAASATDTDALSASLSAFTLDIYRSLSSAKPAENLFFSPLSVMTALAMTLMGSKANTHQQLAKVLNLEQDDDKVKEAFAALVAKYKELPSECELRTANMMYSSNHLEMQQTFADTITGHFQAAAKVVDFGGQTEAVRQEINTAVEKETNSRITNLIPQGVLNGLTRLVLVNAVYFKGLWVKPFNKAATRDRPFYTSETDTVQVPMMHLTTEFQYMVRQDLQATVLTLEYKGSNLSLVVVLPDSRTGLAGVESKLTGEMLRELGKPGRKLKVEVALPRFKLEWQEDLVTALKQMGAPDLFTEGVSDLSGIGGPPGDLFVSNVLHKAFLDVNEEGTEAAAATAAIAMTRAMIRPTPSFVADRPFVFVLYDTAAQLPLFAGRLVAPNTAPPKDEL